MATFVAFFVFSASCAHAQKRICTSYLQLIDICTQLFAGKSTNQNREYYKVNDNSIYIYLYFYKNT